jgi:hypothetical protein
VPHAGAKAETHTKAEEQMTDHARHTPRVPEMDDARADDGASRHGAGPAPRKRSTAGGRIAATGVGIAAMLGLVANMEMADVHAKAAAPTTPSATKSAQRSVTGVRQGKAAPGKVATAKQNRPIVLTPHAVVHTVAAPSSGGGGGGGYAYSAPAAAPVASSGGS